MSDKGDAEGVLREGEGAAEAAGKKQRRAPTPAPTAELGLVPARELSRRLGLPLKYIRRLTAEGELPFERIGSGRYYDPGRAKKVVLYLAAYNKDGRYVG